MTVAILDLDGVCNCVAARKAARYLTAADDKALAPVGFRITQFTILNKLARLGPMTIKRLAADRTTLSINVRQLERDGLLVTAAAEDSTCDHNRNHQGGQGEAPGGLTALDARSTQV
jgi:hypothetical protein